MYYLLILLFALLINAQNRPGFFGDRQGFPHGSRRVFFIGEAKKGWINGDEGYKHGEKVGFDHSVKEGYKHGEKVGFDHGDDKGYEHGLKDGFEYGKLEGFEHGKEEGWEDGERHGFQLGEKVGFEHGDKIGIEIGFQDGWEHGDKEGFHRVTEGFTETVDEHNHEQRIEELGQENLHSTNPFEALASEDVDVAQPGSDITNKTLGQKIQDSFTGAGSKISEKITGASEKLRSTFDQVKGTVGAIGKSEDKENASQTA